MSPEIVIAKHLINDHTLSNDLNPHNIDISKSMVKAFKSAHDKYISDASWTPMAKMNFIRSRDKSNASF